MNNVLTDDKELQFDPLLMPMHPNGSLLTREESVAMWLCLKDTSEEVYQLLSSMALADAMSRMRQTVQLTDDIAMRIASLLRMLYFGKVSLEQFPALLQNEVRLPQEKIDMTMSFIRTEILPLKAPKKVEEEVIDASKIAMVSLALLDALSKYSRINDQQVTSNRIKIRSEKESVRGSVRNWLRAYRDIAGARQHSSVERGQFLFQAENTKKLSVQEREKVAVILKSLDENELLTINPDKQEIVFPTVTLNQQPQSTTLRETTISTERISASNTPSQTPTQRTMKPPTMKTFNFSRSATIASVAPIPTIPTISAVPERLTVAQQSSVPAPTIPDANQFHFSSGHVLPAEKQMQNNVPNQTRTSMQKSSFGLGFNSGLSVAPQKKEVWEIPDTLQNVVDLRSDE